MHLNYGTLVGKLEVDSLAFIRELCLVPRGSSLGAASSGMAGVGLYFFWGIDSSGFIGFLFREPRQYAVAPSLGFERRSGWSPFVA